MKIEDFFYVLSHDFNVELDGLAHQRLNHFKRIGGSDAAWKIRNVLTEYAVNIFADDRVLRLGSLNSKSACCKISASGPKRRATPKCPIPDNKTSEN